MKKAYLLLILLLGIISIRCTDPRPKTIEKPVYGLQNTTTLEINKIILTDSATILYIDAYFYPNSWIRIDSATYLQAEGKKYTITGSDSIDLNKEHWMPKDGKEHFTLYFPPLPKGTKTVDFIESDCDNCFKIWDIDLTGKAKPYKAQLPDDILNFKANKDYKLPAPIFKMDKAKVTLTLTGLKDGYALGDPMLRINNIFAYDSDEVTGQKESEGKYTFDIDMYSTSTGFITWGDKHLGIILNPGDNVEVYYDMTAHSKHISRYNPQPNLIYAGFKGGLAELNSQILQYSDSITSYNSVLAMYSNIADSTILKMDEKQYIDYIFKLYNDKNTKVDKSNLPEAVKQIIKGNQKSNLVDNITWMGQVFENNYRIKNNLNWDKPITETLPKLTEKELINIKRIDLNDPMWIYSGDFKNAAMNLISTIRSKSNFKDVADNTAGLFNDLKNVLPITTKASSQTILTPEESKILAEASSPYYQEVYKKTFERSKQKYDEALSKGGFVIEATPNVKKDKVLETIVAKYKGQVIFVDIWATWCGPCISAMKTIKPIKPEMKEKGVVSLYISGETSPKGKWVEMLPSIGGIHYYLNDEQWRGLHERYKFNGIPTYIIFDKKGKLSYQSTGYPGNEKIMEELKKVL